HHEELAQPDTFDEALSKIAFHFDEPFGDASAMPVGLVSKLARRQVTMALTGDGGDEVLSGYTTYVAEKFAGNYRKVPAVVRKGLKGSADLLSRFARGGLRYRSNRLQRTLHLSEGSFDERFISKLALLDRNSIRSLI